MVGKFELKVELFIDNSCEFGELFFMDMSFELSDDFFMDSSFELG